MSSCLLTFVPQGMPSLLARTDYHTNDLNTLVLSTDTSNSLASALEELRRGGLVAFPTDTVYGVGALVNDINAVKRLYAAKGRTTEKAIPVLVGQISDVNKIAVNIPPGAQQLMDTFWPGALTLVLTKLSTVSDAISRGDTIAVRMPDHPWLLNLLKSSGPLAVTSANRSGGQNPMRASHVLDDLCTWIDLLIDGGDSQGGIPSTIVDSSKDPPKILRSGPISGGQIRQALASQHC